MCVFKHLQLMLPHGGCRHCVAELLGLMHFW